MRAVSGASTRAGVVDLSPIAAELRSFSGRGGSTEGAILITGRAGGAADPVPIGGRVMAGNPFLAAPIDLHRSAHYVHWGIVQISVPNLIAVGLPVLVLET